MSEKGKQKLSRDELSELLNLREKATATAEPAEDGRRVSRYDFSQPSRFNKSELDSLRKINESLAQGVAGGLSKLMEAGLKVRLEEMDQMKWGDLTEDSGDCGPGFAFKMDPGNYDCAFLIDRKLAVHCVDRLTGGMGPLEAEETEDEKEAEAAVLTPLEQKLLVKIAGCFLHKLPEIWAGAGPLEVAAGEFVDDLSDYGLMSPEEDVFWVSFLVQSTIGTGRAGLAVPFQAIQSLPPSSHQTGRNVARSNEDVEKSLRGSLEGSPVTLTAVLGNTDMKVRNLLNIETGDVLLLGKAIDARMDLLINKRPKMKGYVGISSGKYAVKIDNREE